jgi:hypothetical protein
MGLRKIMRFAAFAVLLLLMNCALDFLVLLFFLYIAYDFSFLQWEFRSCGSDKGLAKFAPLTPATL